MKRATSGEDSPATSEVNPLKRVIPKRVKLRDFVGCSALRDYELLEKIGEGTFGSVISQYCRQASDMSTGRSTRLDRGRLESLSRSSASSCTMRRTE